mmetsp:Transcript_15612/g.47568  ORF Transcript_15612/g.47568 Transcript_15612/m.47568 type:complete len:171 (-) Transcript_15612:969-1481(-)
MVNMWRALFHTAAAPALVQQLPSRAMPARSHLGRLGRLAMSTKGASVDGALLADGTYESVQNYYGKVLESSKDLKTSACTSAARPPPAFRRALQNVPNAVLERFYGCGNPLPPSIDGLSVLDLGSGSGRDCYAAVTPDPNPNPDPNPSISPSFSLSLSFSPILSFSLSLP